MLVYLGGTYDTHPLHLEFVQTRWISEVTDFMEMNYVPYTED